MNRHKTDIEYADYDKLQSWRVWGNGNIIWFARTEKEAKNVLKKWRQSPEALGLKARRIKKIKEVGNV